METLATPLLEPGYATRVIHLNLRFGIFLLEFNFLFDEATPSRQARIIIRVLEIAGSSH